jgi:NADH dehydrogenase/NADH:ubiquinone oxidoreductase subunit G
MALPDILAPYEKLITIILCGREYDVPENNSILRCLQFLDIEHISHADLCWNGDCLNCQVWIRQGEKEKAVMACRANATDGMEIIRTAEAITLREHKQQ